MDVVTAQTAMMFGQIAGLRERQEIVFMWFSPLLSVDVMRLHMCQAVVVRP